MKTLLTILGMSVCSIFGIGINAQSLKKANNLFKSGRFLEAKNEYAAILEKDPAHLKALMYMGYISLLSNRLDESESYINRAKAIKPKRFALNQLLAETFYRRDEYQKTVPLFKALGREAMAKKMDCFKNRIPYETEKNFDEIRLDFVITDPLPVVKVKINGEFQGNFLIDTGGGELILDEKFAKTANAMNFGVEKGSEFGGGKKAPLGHGKIESITLANQTIKNIPIVTLDLHQIVLDSIRIDGIIGTVFLYHFLSTIDYKNGQLILRNKLKYTIDNILEKSHSPQMIPFTMADDHFILTNGSINNSDTMLFFLDTGLAGNAFTCPKSTLKKTGLKIQNDKKFRAIGGGGYFNSYPFDIDRICIGDLCVENLHGQYGPFPPQLEKSFGFTINGLLSHEFFRKYALTLDFKEMKYMLSE